MESGQSRDVQALRDYATQAAQEYMEQLRSKSIMLSSEDAQLYFFEGQTAAESDAMKHWLVFMGKAKWIGVQS